MNNTILDTQENKYLAYDPPNTTDNIIWVEDRDADAYEFHNAVQFNAQLSALNAEHPERYVGGGGVGTPK